MIPIMVLVLEPDLPYSEMFIMEETSYGLGWTVTDIMTPEINTLPI